MQARVQGVTRVMPRVPLGLFSLLLLFLSASIVTWNGAQKHFKEVPEIIYVLMADGRVKFPEEGLAIYCASVRARELYLVGHTLSWGAFLGIVGVFIYRFVVYRLRGPEARSQANGGGIESGNPSSTDAAGR